MRKRYSLVLAALLSLALAASAAAGVPITNIGTLHCNDADGNALLLNQVFTIQGVVTANQPTGSNNRLYIQDATGGINVFGAPQNCALQFGDLVEVTGTLIQFSGLTELASVTGGLPLTLTILSSGNPPPAAVALTIPDFNGIYQASNCEPLESARVRLTGLLRTAGGAMPAPGANFAANTNYRLINFGPDSLTNFATVRIVQSSNGCSVTNPLVGTPIPVGCPVDVTGVASQFDGTIPYTVGYQLLPAAVGDVQLNCGTPSRSTTWGQVKVRYR
ncbi:MAG: hypothetical protein MUC69_09815 [Gemmatimonadales bacterium]|nr:hypothetical protein [Gemmatimonadales bacterium]